MRALVLERPGPLAEGEPLRLRDVPDPTPGPGELLIRVGACAVCRTDLQLVEGDLAAHRLPTIPGHQVVGRVEAVGDGVAELVARRSSRRRLARAERAACAVPARAAGRTSVRLPASPPGIATGASPSGWSHGPTSCCVSPAASTTRPPRRSCAAA